MSNSIVVNLKIFNRNYKIKVPPEEESFVRKTAEDINNHIADFQKKYRGRDVQDYFALTMIARMTTAKPELASNDDEVIEELERIGKLIN